MSDNSLQAPLWLDIKPQYIDENFERAVDYLQNQAGNANDSFYKIGLAEHIKILDAPELKAYAEEYKRYL